MIIKEAIQKIEEEFTIHQAEDFDNVGLLCGNPENELTGILVAHDVLEKVVQEAINHNLNLIIGFHPIVFSGLKKITGKTYVEKTLLKALENKIAIYAVHTAFDNDYYGVNYKICEVLGLKNQQILMPKKENLLQLSVYVPMEYSENLKNALFQAGAGNIGFYDQCSFAVHGNGTFKPNLGAKPFSGMLNIRENTKEEMISVIFENYKKNTVLEAMKTAHPYEEVAYQIYQLENENHFAGLGRFGDLENEMSEADFLQWVKDLFKIKVIRHSGFLGKSIKKVGVLGGSGASGISAALAKNCDAYISADFKYHDFFQHQNKMLICDIGHFESEQFVSEQIFEKLSKKFTKFAVLKSQEKTNPVNYFI